MDNIFKFSDETLMEATAEGLERQAAIWRNLWDEWTTGSVNKNPSRRD